MARINFGRMLLAGLIAAVVFDVLAFVVNRSFLASEWEFALAAIGQPAPEVDDVVVANIWRAIAGFSAACRFPPRAAPHFCRSAPCARASPSRDEEHRAQGALLRLPGPPYSITT